MSNEPGTESQEAQVQRSLPSVLSSLLASAIARRVFPGCVLLIAQDGAIKHTAAHGSTMYTDPGSQPVTLETYYDIASLTKVFTSTVALHLLDAGLLHLDQAVTHYLPTFQARTVTIRHLLTHTSGLNVRLSTLCHLSPSAIRAAVYAREPELPPGTCTSYVNINSLLLGDVVAQVTGQPLDTVIQQVILEPLHMCHTMFCPPPVLHPHIAPTEWDDTWRGKLVHGTVHDESAAALGGIAGHAGLFSTAADLWRFTQMWLDGGVWASKRILTPETVALATTYQTDWLHLDTQYAASTIRCGLGWMLDRPEIMGQASPGSYGHTGFTGPVLVIVPTRQAIVVLLNNRTYPRRTERAHFPVISSIVDAVLQDMQ